MQAVDLTVVRARPRAAPHRLALGPRELLLGTTLLVIASMVIEPVTDVDYWWHIQTGRWILAHHRLPAHDLYTYTAVGHPWTDHEYLTEVLMWLLQLRFGPAGVSVALGLVTVLGFVFVLRTAELRRPMAVVLGVGLVLGALAGMPVWGARPQMITFALACLELYWLHRYLAGAGRTIHCFPLVMVLWANLHGGWIIAFAFLGLAVLHELVSWVADTARREHLGRAWRLAGVGILSAAAVACTPNGLALYLYPLRTQESSAQQRFISEWQTPNFHDVTFLPFFGMLLVLLVGFSLRRPRAFDLMLAVSTLALALISLRHIPLFVAAATPALVTSWSDALRPLGDRLQAWHRPTAPSAARNASAVLALVLMTLVIGAAIARAEGREDQVVRQRYPVAAVDRLTADTASCDRIFNDYGWGGYLIDRLSADPRRRVFIFGEADVMGDALIYRWRNIMEVGPGWRANLDRSGADCVVVPPDAPVAGALSTQRDWHLLYADHVAVLYERRAQQPAVRST